MSMCKFSISVVMTATTLCISQPSVADLPTFTFNPGAAAPSLAGSAFTADSILYTNAVSSVVQADTTFVSHRVVDITGFTLKGVSVSPAGFGSAYGLYFNVTDFGLSTPTSLTFTSQTIVLMADPGNHDGSVTGTVGGIAWTNTGPTGIADDFILGSGVSLSSAGSLDIATGVRTTEFVDTLTPAPGEIGFFVSPPGTLLLDFLTSAPPGALINHPQPDGTNIQTVNGGTGRAVLVPEPASLALLGVGVLGMAVIRRRIKVTLGQLVGTSRSSLVSWPPTCVAMSLQRRPG